MNATSAMKWIFVIFLIAVSRGALSAVETDADLAKGTEAELGRCRITAVSAYAWRDWMPVVEKPGPDGGSPLRAKVKLTFDNSKGDATKFTFRGAVVDDKGQQHDAKFAVLPNFNILPVEVQKAYRDLDEKTQKDLIAKYNVVWDGSLKPGESREVELHTLEGSYLTVGSAVCVKITWTDLKGQSVVVQTRKCMIERTD